MRAIIVAFISILVIGLIVLMLWGCPTYNVWAQEMNGRAELARAEQNKQIMFIEAEAMLQAEKFNAESEIVRARGMAEAMEIENGTLTETYIKYLWVRGMLDNNNVVYIPLEASLPLLEIKR